MKPRTILRDPLVHFLAAGAALFAAVSILAPPRADDDVILVDRNALLEFIQYRSKAFEPKAAQALLDAMDPAARKRLIADFVEEEALHREALALGLIDGDYVIRQRLVEKLRFLATATSVEPAPADDVLRRFFDERREDYRTPAAASFTHVFFDRNKRGAERALRDAADAAAALQAGASLGAVQGDRFFYQSRYVERTEEAIAAEFGEDAARTIFAAAPGAWFGPLSSEHGAHAVVVTALRPASIPAFDDVRDRVAEDLLREKREAAAQSLIAELVAGYRIEYRDGLGE